MLQWCDTANVPVHLIINKADKLPFQKKQKAYNEFHQYFKGRQVSMQLFSAQDKTGIGEAVDILNGWLDL